MGPTRVMDEEIDLSLSPSLSSSFLVDDDFSRGPISRLSCFPRVRRNHSRLPFHFTYFNAMKVERERGANESNISY